MIRIEPEELSALIDGELDERRAAEVRAAMDSDAALRQQYLALRNVDTQLRALAEVVILDVHVQLPPAGAATRVSAERGRWMLPLLAAIPVAWLIGKLTVVASLAFAASACALAALMTALVIFVVREQAVWRDYDAPDVCE